MNNLSMSTSKWSSRVNFTSQNLARIMRDYKALSGVRSTTLKCLIQHCESLDHSSYQTSLDGVLHLLGYALNSNCEAFSVFLEPVRGFGSWYTIWCRTGPMNTEVPALTIAEASSSELVYIMLCSLAIGTNDDKLAEHLAVAGW